jgi:cytoskeletal protein RodZ
MKQEINNEIDLLLRRLGRRPNAELRPDQNHLDADELSSYAENALPSAARARYTEHIADCSRCRELVVQLSASVELVNAEEVAKVPALSGVRKFLASLLSPMVLRYAVPALGVVLVMIIGFVIVRRERSESVAQLIEPEQKTTVALPQASQSPEGFLTFNDQTKGSPTSAAGRTAGDTKSPQGQPAPPPPNAPPSVTVTTEVKPAAPAPTPERQPLANEPPPAAKVAATNEESKTVNVEAKKETIDNRAVSERGRNTVDLAKGAGSRAEEAGAAQSASAKSKTGSFGAVSTGRARQPVQREGADKDEDAAESRSVAGRNFRKQRGVWIDTAYEASKSLTTLSRGSEQFRALVADEPVIKTIADQLDGEIIVVWKGRAYRIR